MYIHSILGILCMMHSLECTIMKKGFKANEIDDNDATALWSTLNGKPTKIMGHRGEKVLMPEHTLGSYEFAIIQNADFIEPDLVLTKDKHLICFHDLTLSRGTNVAAIPALAHLKGITVKDDWFIPDFTLDEIKLLRVIQTNIGIRPQYFNNMFQIPTFEEFLYLIHNMSLKLNKSIGIVPELKHPEIVNKHFLIPNFMEWEFIQILKEHGYPLHDNETENCRTKNDTKVQCGPVIIQCFNRDSLEYLHTQTSIPLTMLVYDDYKLLTMRALKELSPFITYFGVWKETLVSGVKAILKYNNIKYNETKVKEAGGFIPTKDFVYHVHKAGMEVGIYTIYDSREPSLRGCEVKCLPENKTEELFYYFELGVDAMFVENIKEAAELRLRYDFDQRLNGAKSLGLNNFDPNISSSIVAITVVNLCLSIFEMKN